MNFNSLLDLADEESIQMILGKNALDAIIALDASIVTPSKLRGLISELYEATELLLNKDKRNVLFDILPLNEAKKLSLIYGSDTAEPYEFLKAKNIRKNTNEFLALLSFFEIEEVESFTREVKPFTKEAPCVYSLFAHQRRAVREIEDIFRSPKKRCILHMPTGSGKTRTTMNIICNHLRENEPSVVIWLADSEELCEQAAEEFEKSWANLGDRNLSVYRYWGDKKIGDDELYDGLLVAGLSKLYSLLKKSINDFSYISSRTDLVVFDEAHRSVAKTFKLIVDSLVLLKKPNPPLLGLTATPGRTWDEPDEDVKLSHLYYKQKVMLKVDGYENPISYLVKQEYLANVQYRSLFSNSGIELTDADFNSISISTDIPKKILYLLADDHLRNIKIINEIERLAKNHKRIIFFATTVEHSNLIASLLKIRNYNASSVTGETGSILRESLINEFKDTTEAVRIICNFGVLTTGFDAPRTSAALIARPTKSLVLYSQMVGRAIRGVKAGGNKNAEIVTVIDHKLPGFSSVASAFENWEDIWE